MYTLSRRSVTRRALVVLGALVFALVPAVPAAADPLLGPAPADANLVSLDTPAVLEPGRSSGRLNVRWFSGDENLAYTSLGLRYGLREGWEALLRGSFAPRRSFALPGGGAIRHGGSDVEIAAKFRPAEQPGARFTYAGLIGLSLASTPAQKDPFVTLGAAAAFPLGERGTAYLNPRAVFIEDNTLIGIGIGAHARLSERTAVFGEYTPLIAGDNTRDTVTGRPRRRDLYGLGLRFTAAPGAGTGHAWEVEVGFTNGTGLTTGFGLTPGLGGSGAFYASLAFAR